MKTSDFYYHLPEEQIAQSPASPRDSSRLMHLQRGSSTIGHHIFSDLPQLLRPGDLLVVNDSKVLPARLIGHKDESGGLCELLLLRNTQGDEWECLARPGRRLRPGMKLIFGDGSLTAEILETLPNGSKRVVFTYDTVTLYEKLDSFGQMPLPPYIKQKLTDNSDYQTVYAKAPGSAAAPTAGLHFTKELLERLKNNGVLFTEVTLHVGLGTFRPVQEREIADHQMHTEWYSISDEAAARINQAKAEGRRVIAVGTTSCRTLEAAAQQYGGICPCSGETDIFIYPGRPLRVIDGLITNFHLPESTLLMLVAAFYGYEPIMHAYEEAVKQKYRFFSFGDAMLVE